jgi:hypothetical protein
MAGPSDNLLDPRDPYALGHYYLLNASELFFINLNGFQDYQILNY